MISPTSAERLATTRGVLDAKELNLAAREENLEANNADYVDRKSSLEAHRLNVDDANKKLREKEEALAQDKTATG